MAKPKLFIGTSGWYYEHWEEVFYPKELSAAKRLTFYSQHFKTVEINNTFYHLPKSLTFEDWRGKVPADFIFSVKASNYITHIKRLKEGEQTTSRFFERVELLKDRLGPILFQLPPSFKQDLARLEDFLSHLKEGHRYTFEFRHPSWYEDNTYQLLKQKNCALCVTDLKGILSPLEVTASFVYIRLHGPREAAYQGRYGSKLLQPWKERIQQWQKKKLDVFCYFDNDEKSYAVKDAKNLLEMMNI